MGQKTDDQLEIESLRPYDEKEMGSSASSSKSELLLAKVKIATGVPALIIVFFGLIIAYRYADGALSAPVLIGFSMAILIVFGFYFWTPVKTLLKAGRRGAKGA